MIHNADLVAADCSPNNKFEIPLVRDSEPSPAQPLSKEDHYIITAAPPIRRDYTLRLGLHSDRRDEYGGRLESIESHATEQCLTHTPSNALQLDLGLGTHSYIERKTQVDINSTISLGSPAQVVVTSFVPLEALDELNVLVNLEPPPPHIATLAPLLQPARLPSVPSSPCLSNIDAIV
ncbi:uncharacterized protein FIBRA_09165 [Fibroporia radiculosa]|uniref:Uncharacterized protein n=1 Tax=Fibroporia radiculosa TaxID=599839 RepID=J4H5J7_9APHY|nr:uncharacterized protein FIBRA_09165 [Fibroporia radiculosa]CCM06859.1 predicted protein [Fibroporia radiculosa]